MKTLAVIGGHGMLGSDLVRNFSTHFSVSTIHKGNYQSYIGKKFDIVVNANGNSRRYWANAYPLEDFELSTKSVYKSIFDFHFNRYIYISSSDVYNDHEDREFTSENAVIDPHELSFYGFHKYLSETIVRRHVKHYLIFRSCLILGRHLKKGPFYDILHNKDLFIGRNSRLQLITTDEIANIIDYCLKQNIKNETYNVGGSGTVSFKDIDKYFLKPVIFSKTGETQVYEMDVTKLRNIFPIKSSKEYLINFVIGL